MLDMLARSWWMPALRGCLAMLFGVTALVWPGVTVLALVGVFAAYALMDGATALGFAMRGVRTGGGWGWWAVQGVIGIAAGAVTLSSPGMTAIALVWVLALRALTMGVVDITVAIRFRNEFRHEWMLAVSGALSVVLAVLFLAWPARGALAAVSLIGVYALVAGTALLGLGLRLRRLHRTMRPAATDRTPLLNPSRR